MGSYFAEKSIERKFAEDLDATEEVCVYAKLPRTFQIPTPVGNYSPDWAIAFYEGKVKHIFFVAETKGTMESLELRPIEQAKIYNFCKYNKTYPKSIYAIPIYFKGILQLLVILLHYRWM